MKICYPHLCFIHSFDYNNLFFFLILHFLFHMLHNFVSQILFSTLNSNIPNLKIYLNDNELLELYKYSLYNNVNLLLIEKDFKEKLNYENVLIIDEDFNDYLI